MDTMQTIDRLRKQNAKLKLIIAKQKQKLSDNYSRRLDLWMQTLYDDYQLAKAKLRIDRLEKELAKARAPSEICNEL